MTISRLLGLALVLAPVSAYGQTRNPFEGQPAGPLLRNDVAGSRQIPGFEPEGVQAGPLTVLPRVTGSVEGDTNVLNSAINKRRDVFFTLAPAVTATGTTGKSQYVLQAEAAVSRYATLARQNRETWGLDAQVSTPIASGLTVAASGTYARKFEPYYAAGASTVIGGPTLYDKLEADLGLSADLGTMRLTGTASILRLDYRALEQGNGTLVDQAFRDSRNIALGLKAERTLAAGREIFAEGEYHWIDSLQPLLCCDRTSTGGRALGGVRSEIGHLVNVELAAGYQWRKYRSAVFRDYGGLAWRARIEWYATPLVSVALTGRRDIVNSGLQTASGVVLDTAMLRVFYELRRNFNLILTGAHSHEDYRDTGVTARGDSATLEGSYNISRHYAVAAYGRYRNRTSNSSLLPAQGDALEGGLSLRFSM
jgi:hypothetical protein